MTVQRERGLSCLTFKEITRLSNWWFYHFTFLTSIYENFSFSTLLSTLGIVSFFISINLGGVQWYLGVQWYPNVLLICISLMAKDTEHLFMCSFTICLSSLVKYLFKSFAFLKNWFVCLVLQDKQFFTFWIKVLCHIHKMNIFPSPGLPFHFLMSVCV